MLQATWNQAPVTSTGSVKFTVMLASRGALDALMIGSRLSTAGPISMMGAVRRGFGAPAVKSAPLLLVSWNPSAFRKAAVELVRAGALAAPSRQVAVVP